jgi:hydrogenase maturation protease
MFRMRPPRSERRREILVFAVGNESRGDDGLGPLIKRHLEEKLVDLPSIDFLEDFQFQVEHVYDLMDRVIVLLIDAHLQLSKSCRLEQVMPIRDPSLTTHALNPAGLLWLYESVVGKMPPPTFLLAVQGQEFELGSGLSATGLQNFSEATSWGERLLRKPDLSFWLRESGRGEADPQ